MKAKIYVLLAVGLGSLSLSYFARSRPPRQAPEVSGASSPSQERVPAALPVALSPEDKRTADELVQQKLLDPIKRASLMIRMVINTEPSYSYEVLEKAGPGQPYHRAVLLRTPAKSAGISGAKPKPVASFRIYPQGKKISVEKSEHQFVDSELWLRESFPNP